MTGADHGHGSRSRFADSGSDSDSVSGSDSDPVSDFAIETVSYVSVRDEAAAVRLQLQPAVENRLNANDA